MCGTAAAASSRSTVTRTISEPARASAATWATVAATSPVSVFVIDWTTVGAPFVHYRGRIDLLTMFLSLPAMPVYVAAWLVALLIFLWPVMVVMAQFDGINLSILWSYWTELIPALIMDQQTMGMLLIAGSIVARSMVVSR